jgi:hypothetical protein
MRSLTLFGKRSAASVSRTPSSHSTFAVTPAQSKTQRRKRNLLKFDTVARLLRKYPQHCASIRQLWELEPVEVHIAARAHCPRQSGNYRRHRRDGGRQRAGEEIRNRDGRNAGRPMSVYFISARELDMVKIGYAFDPIARLRHLQTACPIQLTLEGAIPGGFDKEQELHGRYVRARVRGEWFKLTPSIEAEISLSTKPKEFTWAAVRVWRKGLEQKTSAEEYQRAEALHREREKLLCEQPLVLPVSFRIDPPSEARTARRHSLPVPLTCDGHLGVAGGLPLRIELGWPAKQLSPNASVHHMVKHRFEGRENRGRMGNQVRHLDRLGARRRQDQGSPRRPSTGSMAHWRCRQPHSPLQEPPGRDRSGIGRQRPHL